MRITKYSEPLRSSSLVSKDFWRSRDRLYDWWDDHMKKIEQDFSSRSGTLSPYYYDRYSLFAPERRRRLFDTWFNDYNELVPTSWENRTDQAIEYHILTGPGDYFKPADLEINVRGREVEIKGRREEKTYDGASTVVREMRKVIRVPDSVNTGLLTAEIRNSDKILVRAPFYYASPTPRYYPAGIPLRINRIW